MTEDAITLTKRKQACENNYYSVFLDNLDQKNQITTKDYLTISSKIKTDKMVFGVGVFPVQENKFSLLKILDTP